MTQLRATAASTELLAAIVQSSQDAIIGKSLTEQIQSWNPAATRLYAWSAQEALGQQVDVLVSPKTSALWNGTFRACPRRRTPGGA